MGRSQEDRITDVVLEHIAVTKGDEAILHDVTLAVRDGELLSVVGASGSGKSTLLRTVAGLDQPESGVIRFDGIDMTSVPTRERNVAMVFQDNVLFPFMRARDNVAWPLSLRSIADEEITRRVDAEGRALEISDIFDHWPRELSAGHQQLIQVARAMVRVPAAFLLDEPLARVDAGRRTGLRADLRRLQQGYRVTTIYVTNDPVEAMAISDRIAVLDAGRIVQVAEPMTIYDRPGTRFVAELMGERPLNVIPAVVEGAAGEIWLTGDGFRIRAWAEALDHHRGSEVLLGVRPEHVVDDPAGFDVTTERTVTLGDRVERRLLLGGHEIWSRDTPGPPPDRVGFRRIHVFDTAGETIAHIG